MLYLPKLRECFYKLAYNHQITRHFAFCGGRTPQLTFQGTNIRAIFSGLNIRPPAPTMHYNTLRETMPIFTRSCKSRSWILLHGWLLDSVQSPEKAINRSKELVHLLHLGGFKLKRFVSNVQNLADRTDGSPQPTEPKVNISCRLGDSSHVLGLKWDHTNDNLVASSGTSCAITKSLKQRLVLSLVSKFFDPIGLLARFTVGARLLLKDIRRVTRKHWDDELPQDKVQRFLVWNADLPKIENVKISWSSFTGLFD